MLCNTPFTVQEVQEALRMSRATKGTSLVQMALEAEAPAAATTVDKRMKTKPGKQPWTKGTKY